MKTIIDIYNNFEFARCSNVSHNYKIQNDIERYKQFFKNYNESNETYNDYILESLKTHDYKLLQNKLLELFPNDILGVEDVYDKGLTDKNAFYIGISNKEILNDNKFIKLLEFFNYTLREYNDRLNTAIIEPIYSKRIKDVNTHVIYHFTKKSLVNDILKKGLIPKTSNYANRPERVYLYIPKNDKLKINEHLIKFINTTFGRNSNTLPDNLAIIKIDYSKMCKEHNEPWIYKDTVMNFDEAAFIMEKIPAKYLSEINIKN